MKQCVRDKLGRFQKHDFAPETNTGEGYESICKNCNIRRYQTYFERKITEYWQKRLLDSCKIFMPKLPLYYPNFTGKKIRWRKYNRLSKAN